jgi:hypothetical protein
LFWQSDLLQSNLLLNELYSDQLVRGLLLAVGGIVLLAALVRKFVLE